MTPDEVAGIQEAFGKSIEPIVAELRRIHGVLDEHSDELRGICRALDEHTRVLNDHSRLLNDHSQLLGNIDGRLVRVEGILDGVEILVRTKTGS